jgi:hypothetical protein
MDDTGARGSRPGPDLVTELEAEPVAARISVVYY